MKTILTETLSVIKVSLFWMLALPAAAIIFPVAACFETVRSLIKQGPRISIGPSFIPQARAAGR